MRNPRHKLTFLGNLILNTSTEFDHDHVTTAIGLNIINGDVAQLALKASRKEQRSVIRFLWAKGLNALMPFTVHTDVHPVYGDKRFKRPAIHVRYKTFAHRRESIDDEKRPGRLAMQPTISSQHRFSSGIYKLVDRWNECLKEYGRHVEKYTLYYLTFKTICLLNVFIIC